MKCVRQTRFGQDGNCLAACVASLLEVPLETVDFTAGHGWLHVLDAKIRPLGYCCAVMYNNGNDIRLIGDCLLIACGNSPRNRFGDTNELHACVMCKTGGAEAEFDDVFDPHPSNAFLDSIDYVVLLLPHRLEDPHV